MSLVSHLYKYDNEMSCFCPACGCEVEVENDDFNQYLDDGSEEYYLYCHQCGGSFYASKIY